MLEYFISSLFLLLIWLIIYSARPFVRKELIVVSSFTTAFSLTGPLFIPEYWNPPTLFNLSTTIGVDIESLIFSFAIGGIASVFYEAIFGFDHQKMNHTERQWFHWLTLMLPPLVFIPLHQLTQVNPIYSVSIAMFSGGFFTILCRPDLKWNILVGGVLFTGFYFIFFLIVNLIFPNFINVWNFTQISGIIILGVPLEEILFAFTFGMIWSSVYEHILGYRL